MQLWIILILSCKCCLIVCHVCSFDGGLVGSWASNNYGTITITSTTLTLGEHRFVINSKTTNTVFECHMISGTTYVLISEDTLTLALENTVGHVYLCLQFTKITDESYYFYMNSLQNNQFANDRIKFWSLTATAPQYSDICSETASMAEVNTILKTGSEQSTFQNCPNILLNNFYYDRTTSTGTSGNCVNSVFNPLKVCEDRQTLQFNKTECGTPIMFTKNGNLGCVTSVVDGSTYYVNLYNTDPAADINSFTRFQFICIMVSLSSDGSVQMTAIPKRCEQTQTTTTRPNNGELYVLTSYHSCVPVDDDSSSSPVALIVGLTIGLLLLLILIIVGIIFLVVYCKRRRDRQRLKSKIKQNISSFKQKLKIRDIDDKHPLSESSFMAEAAPVYKTKPKTRALKTVSDVIFPSVNINEYKNLETSHSYEKDTLRSSRNRSGSQKDRRTSSLRGRYNQSLPDLAECSTPSTSRASLSRGGTFYQMSRSSSRMSNLRKSISLNNVNRRMTNQTYPKINRFASDSRINKPHLARKQSSVQKPEMRHQKEKVKQGTLQKRESQHIPKLNDVLPRKTEGTLPSYMRPLSRSQRSFKQTVKKEHDSSFAVKYPKNKQDRPIILSGNLDSMTDSMLQNKKRIRSQVDRVVSMKNSIGKKKIKSPYLQKAKRSQIMPNRSYQNSNQPEFEPYGFYLPYSYHNEMYASRKFATEADLVSDEDDVFVDENWRSDDRFHRKQRSTRKTTNEDSGFSGESLSSEDQTFQYQDITAVL